MTMLIAWLITYALHSSLLLGLAWLVTRFTKERWALDESLWKVALCGGILTASVQLGLGVSPKLAALDIAAFTAPAEAVTQPMVASSREVIVFDDADTIVVSEAPAASAVTPAWPQASQLLLGVWLLGAGFGAWRMLHGWLLLRRRLRRRRIVFSGPLLAELRRLAGGDEVRLAICNALPVPIARGVWRQEIVVPERVFELGLDEQRALLAHELAHLRRRDPAWRMVAELCRSVLWFQPLNWLAARQLARLAELLCDDWAARRSGDRLALARCLSEVAAWLVTDEVESVPAMAMAARRSELSQRVAKLLDDGSPERRRIPPAAGFAAMVLLAGLMWAAPGAAITPETETPRATEALATEALAAEGGAVDRSLQRAIHALRDLRHTLRQPRVPTAPEPPPEIPKPQIPKPQLKDPWKRWPLNPSLRDRLSMKDLDRMIEQMLEDLPRDADVERIVEEALRRHRERDDSGIVDPWASAGERQRAERSLARAERRAAEASRKAEAARRAQAEADREAQMAKQRVERLRKRARAGSLRSKRAR